MKDSRSIAMRHARCRLLYPVLPVFNTLRRIWLWVGIVLFVFVTPVHAREEVRMFWESRGESGFLQKEETTYIPLYSPTSDSLLGSQTRWGWYVSDGIFGLGLEQYQISATYLNQAAGELTYDLYTHKRLTKSYTDLAGRITSYHRRDMLLDLRLAHGSWNFTGGFQFMTGSQLFCFDLRNGTASQQAGNEIPYDVRGRYALWKGYANDLGHGIGCHLSLEYRPSDRLALRWSGRDLGGWILWRNIDEYHGTVDLNLIREENGVRYVHAPLEGTYLSDGFLRIPLIPIWRGEIEYRLSSDITLSSWVENSAGWDAGIYGTLTRKHGPALSLGVAHLSGKWLGQVAVAWSGVAIEFAANVPGPMTHYRLGVQLDGFSL